MAQKAPGKNHREGISLIELAEMFPDEATATAWFEALIWPTGRHCPRCGSTTETTEASATSGLPYWCPACRRSFSVRIGTTLERSRVPLRKWAFAVYLYVTSLKGVSSMKLHRDLKVTQKTAWFMLHRLREAWGESDGLPPFSGPVEADETYIGGKRKNKSNAQRKAATGRGSVDMEAVVGVKDRATNKVVARPIPSTSSPYTAGFVAERAAPGATVYTDEAASYNVLDPWFDREAVNHKAHEYVRGAAHTNGMESFWSMLKRGYHGTYHHMSAKHLDRYVAEFSGRHNIREADTADQMAQLVAASVGKRLMYRDLIADNGLSSGSGA